MMDSVLDDDYELADTAEQDLQEWATEPFLAIFDQIQPPSSHRSVTLQDYLTPETCRYLLCYADGRLEPFLDYTVPDGFTSDMVNLAEVTLSPSWLSFYPRQIELQSTDCDEPLSQFPRKVSAGGKIYFFKPVDSKNKRGVLREMNIYRKMEETLESGEVINTPRLHAVVRDEFNATLIGLLLSWIDCDNTTLECVLTPDTPSYLREKWYAQVTTTLSRLHQAPIIWGDAKAANVLVDANDDAWMIDFGGGYTRGWVDKDRWRQSMATMRVFSRSRSFSKQTSPRGSRERGTRDQEDAKSSRRLELTMSGEGGARGVGGSSSIPEKERKEELSYIQAVANKS
ncbi:uncharacterized protein N7459_001974 [Penicillium hispanicum]|uniref:uncharacterized protein n=1 Tax=Penicillium hispanicum TaxID=1080232 RepID=UPI00253FB102|nr:uncharacterized protein N7459_001974 [Penicillium hispanicum]KAJ5591605.1 hypothetical protein N7459_001974 [Penicillium hispanicum]